MLGGSAPSIGPARESSVHLWYACGVSPLKLTNLLQLPQHRADLQCVGEQGPPEALKNMTSTRVLCMWEPAHAAQAQRRRQGGNPGMDLPQPPSGTADATLSHEF